MVYILQTDLDHILAHSEGIWEEFRGRRLFLTGGTGFFGGWLLESLLHANATFHLSLEVTVLTRHPETFTRKAPHLARHPAVTLHAGDVKNFAFPAGQFSHVVHAATDASVLLNEMDPLSMLDTIVEGTRHVLDFAGQSGAKKLLFTSSGAVYGRQPPELSHLTEDYRGAPDPLNPGSAYGEGKRAAELLCALYAKQYGLEPKIARCFTFVGPGMPLDAHFAIGNFIRDAVKGGPITVKGDGTPFRSYLYAADLVVWLWTILVRGRVCWPYNVGSAHPTSIADLARKVAESSGNVPVIVSQSARADVLPERYVPSVSRAIGELNVQSWVTLEQAIRRTVDWQRHHL
jgi:dTDP-glucose 4,6-dehydratase